MSRKDDIRNWILGAMFGWDGEQRVQAAEELGEELREKSWGMSTEERWVWWVRWYFIFTFGV